MTDPKQCVRQAVAALNLAAKQVAHGPDRHVHGDLVQLATQAEGIADGMSDPPTEYEVVRPTKPSSRTVLDTVTGEHWLPRKRKPTV